MLSQKEPLEDQLVVFDDFLTNRVAQWHCTLCGRRPTVRAGTWVCTEAGYPSAAAAFIPTTTLLRTVIVAPRFIDT